MDRQGLLGRDMDDKPNRALAQSDRLDELREEARYRARTPHALPAAPVKAGESAARRSAGNCNAALADPAETSPPRPGPDLLESPSDVSVLRAPTRELVGEYDKPRDEDCLTRPWARAAIVRGAIRSLGHPLSFRADFHRGDGRMVWAGASAIQLVWSGSSGRARSNSPPAGSSAIQRD
jgi:hypothetical protein